MVGLDGSRQWASAARASSSFKVSPHRPLKASIGKRVRIVLSTGRVVRGVLKLRENGSPSKTRKALYPGDSRGRVSSLLTNRSRCVQMPDEHLTRADDGLHIRYVNHPLTTLRFVQHHIGIPEPLRDLLVSNERFSQVFIARRADGPIRSKTLLLSDNAAAYRRLHRHNLAGSEIGNQPHPRIDATRFARTPVVVLANRQDILLS